MHSTQVRDRTVRSLTSNDYRLQSGDGRKTERVARRAVGVPDANSLNRPIYRALTRNQFLVMTLSDNFHLTSLMSSRLKLNFHSTHTQRNGHNARIDAASICSCVGSVTSLASPAFAAFVAYLLGHVSSGFGGVVFCALRFVIFVAS